MIENVYNQDINDIKNIFNHISFDIVKEIDNIKEIGNDNKPSWGLDNENKKIMFNIPPYYIKETNSNIILDYKEFRYQCCCASCVDEMTDIRKIKKEDIKDNISIEYLDSRGNYAVAIKWNDGHESLFPYKKIIDIYTEFIKNN